MLHIYFIRHGQTDWNHIKRFQGQKDVPLNQRGRQQAQATARRLEGVSFDRAYVSDLSRAWETAQIINVHHKLDPVRDDRLRERSFGCFEGYTLDETRQRFPDIREAYVKDQLHFRIPGGESRFEFIQRVGAYFETLRQTHVDQTLLVVAHGGVLGALFSHIISQKLDFEAPRFVPLFSVANCSISQLKYTNDRWLIESLNQTDHLANVSDIGLVEEEHILNRKNP